MFLYQVTAILGTVLLGALGQGGRQGRGFVDDFGKVWSQINHGLDEFQDAANEELLKMKPMAEQLEREIKPAFAQIETRLNQAISNVAGQIQDSPLFDRLDNAASSVYEQAGQAAPDFASLMSGLQTQALDPFRVFGVSRRNWWEGENVCVERSVTEESPEEQEQGGDKIERGLGFMKMDMTMTTCRDGDNYHECTTKVSTNGRRRTIVVKHQCCYGFTRVEGQAGCSKMEMTSVEKTLEELKTVEFNTLADSLGLGEILKENVTVFAPSDDAIEDFRHDLEQLNVLDRDHRSYSYNVDDGLSYRKKRELSVVETPRLSDILKNHVVSGFIDTSDMSDGDRLTTQTGENIRLTVYNTAPTRTVMANCARVTSPNHYASNGIVHVVDKVIIPTTQTLAEIIESDSQFTTLSIVLKRAGLMEALNDRDGGHYTLLAPTDEAFESLDSESKLKIMAGNGCSRDILKSHILANVVCSGVIEGKARTVNGLGKYLDLERDDEDNIFIAGKKVLMRDIVATNGVLHVVEEVILPESARGLDQALEESNSPVLRELFQLANMEESIDAFANTTIFAPSERALKALPPGFLEGLKKDTKKLQEFLLYHVAVPKACKCDFENNKLFQSALSSQNKLRINVFGGSFLSRPMATVQCARLTTLDQELCGGMIHTVEKVLLPPEGKVTDVLRANDEFSEFLQILSASGLEDELNKDAVTLLAPNNEAFGHLEAETREALKSDQDLAAKLVKTHVIADSICCAGIPRHVPFLDRSGRRSIGGRIVSLRKSQGGHIYADRAEVVTCDMVAENGVIHALDRVLEFDQPEAELAEKPNLKSGNPFDLLSLFQK